MVFIISSEVSGQEVRIKLIFSESGNETILDQINRPLTNSESLLSIFEQESIALLESFDHFYSSIEYGNEIELRIPRYLSNIFYSPYFA